MTTATETSKKAHKLTPMMAQFMVILAIARTPVGDHALAWADVSDGTFKTSTTTAKDLPAQIAALRPRELVLPEGFYQDADAMSVLPLDGIALTPQPQTKFDIRSGERRLAARFKVGDLEGLGDFSKAEISAAGALLDYLTLTQAGAPVQLSAPKASKTSGYLAIDPATRASLEIDRTQKGTRAGSLLSVIDRTVTGPGARELSARLNRPLLDVETINQRLDAVAFFHKEDLLRQNLRGHLRSAGNLRDDSRRLIAGLQADYAKLADVPTLKIKHNNVLGYFVEVTPKYADTMLSKGPDSPFIHKQTLVSAVRFTTVELAELDHHRRTGIQY